MADTLFDALSGLNVSGAENPYGMAATSLGAVTPQLITPYTSTGKAIGISLGSVLLQSLLGYQARQEAARQSLEMNTLANQMMKLQTPEERTALIGGVDNSLYQSRLSSLATALTQQEAARKIKADEKLLELETAAKFNLGDLGTQLFEREQQAKLEQLAASHPKKEPKEPKNFWETIPDSQKPKFAQAAGVTKELRDLADQFEALKRYGVNMYAQSWVPGSPEDLALSHMKTLVPTAARLMGEVGNLAQEEQQKLIDSTLGSTISGSQSIATRLRQLANTGENITRTAMQTYKTAAEGGGEAVLQQLEQRGATDPALEAAKKRNAELKARLARLEGLAGQQGK